MSAASGARVGATTRPRPIGRSALERRLRTLALYGVLIAGGLVMIVPFIWMLATSLKTRAEVFRAPMLAFPSGLHFENYERMWNALPGVTFGDFFVNSLKIASLSTVGALISCSLAAFAFAVLPFRGRGLLFALIMATLIIPFQVVLVPNFILYRTLPHPLSDSGNWIGTQEPLWVGAFLGGAFGIFRWIYLPLAKPVLATLAIFTFMWSWNDLINPLIYLRDLPDYTTTVGLSFFQGQYVGKWPEMMAGAVVSLLPMVLLFIIAQQYFVRGIAISGLKG